MCAVCSRLVNSVVRVHLFRLSVHAPPLLFGAFLLIFTRRSSRGDVVTGLFVLYVLFPNFLLRRLPCFREKMRLFPPSTMTSILILLLSLSSTVLRCEKKCVHHFIGYFELINF